MAKTSYFYIIGEKNLLLYHGENKLLLYHWGKQVTFISWRRQVTFISLKVTCFPQIYKSNLFLPMI
jgi:hypothetical protein